MATIAVMGDYDSIYGFAALGLSIFPETDRDSAQQTLRRLVENEFGIIYITEELAAVLEKDIEIYADRVTPAIIRIPGVKGNTGDGIKSVKKSVEQAVGSDILFGDD